MTDRPQRDVPVPSARALRLEPWWLALLAGAVLGVFSLVADVVVAWRWLVVLGNLAAPWVVTAAWVGSRMSSPRRGALGGLVSLLSAAFVYYFLGAVRGYPLGAAVVVWVGVAIIVGPILGSSGGAIARSHRNARSHEAGAPPGVLPVVVLAGVLMGEAVWLLVDRRLWAYDLLADPPRLVDAALVAVLMGLGVFVAVRWLDPDRRAFGLLVLVVATVLVVLALDTVRGVTTL